MNRIVIVVAGATLLSGLASVGVIACSSHSPASSAGPPGGDAAIGRGSSPDAAGSALDAPDGDAGVTLLVDAAAGGDEGDPLEAQAPAPELTASGPVKISGRGWRRPLRAEDHILDGRLRHDRLHSRLHASRQRDRPLRRQRRGHHRGRRDHDRGQLHPPLNIHQRSVATPETASSRRERCRSRSSAT